MAKGTSQLISGMLTIDLKSHDEENLDGCQCTI